MAVTYTIQTLKYRTSLNGKTNVVDEVTYNASNKTYSANVVLKEGSNTIEVTAKNECGNATKSITVTYTKPCIKPAVIISSDSLQRFADFPF